MEVEQRDENGFVVDGEIVDGKKTWSNGSLEWMGIGSVSVVEEFLLIM